MKFLLSCIGITFLIVTTTFLLNSSLISLTEAPFEYLWERISSNPLTKTILTYVVGTVFNTLIAVGSSHPTMLDAVVENLPLPTEERKSFCPAGLY